MKTGFKLKSLYVLIHIILFRIPAEKDGMQTKALKWILFLLALGVCGRAAALDIVVVALFKDKAIVTIDGTRRVLTPGEASPEGVRLISANSDEAVIEVNGQREKFALGSHIGSSFTAASSREVQIFPDAAGMYMTTGSIDGHLINFLVDTGATTIALNSSHAKRLGIDFRYTGKKGFVETASGVEEAYGVILRTVKVGEIEMRDVQATVIDGDFPSDVLLGMSFLGRVDMQRVGKTLTLRKKF